MPEDGPDEIIARLGEPDQRGRWAAGETFLYYEKGMQVNFKDGKVLFLSLYDEGVVLKPGSPPFKKYHGSVDGISLHSTVEEVIQAWGQPTRSYAHGRAGEQTIVLDYEDRHVSLTVWPLIKEKGSHEETLRFPRSDDLNAQRLRSITLYWANSGK